MTVRAARSVLGQLQGFVVDPVTRRLRFFVVQMGLLGRSRLLPVGGASIDVNNRTIELLDSEAIRLSQPFKRDMFPAFSDDDLITAIFGGARSAA